MVLAEQAEARRLASELHLEFMRANEAGTRAVLADTDDASASAARESEQAANHAAQRLDALAPIVQSLGYDDEVNILNGFRDRFAEYRKLDREILPLATENSNLKAQRLAFGDAAAAADALSSALDELAARSTPDLALAATKARLAVREIQVLQARHIAEPDDAGMSAIEEAMFKLETSARDTLESLRKGAGRNEAAFDSAGESLGRFIAANAEVIRLSRRNSDVRSMAATLGRKRVVAAECEERLAALETALAAHTVSATK